MLARRGVRLRRMALRGMGATAARAGGLAVFAAGPLFAALPACGESASEPPTVLDDCPDDLPTELDCPAAAPTYSAVVSRIVSERCGSCHFAANPFSSQVFVDYDDTYAARRSMLTQVYGCNMPPPDAPQLTPEERGALLKWFVCGAPQN